MKTMPYLLSTLFASLLMTIPGTALAQNQHPMPMNPGGPRGAMAPTMGGPGPHNMSGMGAMAGKPGGCMDGGCMKGGMCMHAMGMHGGMGAGYAGMLVKHADELKLTDEQIGKLHRMRMNHMKTQREGFRKVHESMMGISQSILDPAADEATIKKAVTENNAAQQAMLDDAVKERNEANAVLTPDQVKLLKSLKSTDKSGSEDDE